MIKPMLSVLSPAGPRARLPILIFHRVLAQPDPLFPGEIDAVRFDAVCRWLAGWFNVLPLEDAVCRLRERTLPSRAACITFDDGYADNHEIALPILRRHGLTATFFIATGYLDGGCMFNDSVTEIFRRSPCQAIDLTGLGIGQFGRVELDSLQARRTCIEAVIAGLKYRPVDEREALTRELQQRANVSRLPTDLMMSSEQVLALHHSGMRLGAHTVTHPILARLDNDMARHEIVQGRSVLEALTGERVAVFAYPNGKPEEDFSPATVAVVRDVGFDAAVTTVWDTAQAASDPFQLPRFTPWDRTKWRFGLRLVHNIARQGAEASP